MQEGTRDSWPITADGKDVVIIGGGDTGADCLGTAHRQGARSVTQLEIMPQPPDQPAQRLAGAPCFVLQPRLLLQQGGDLGLVDGERAGERPSPPAHAENPGQGEQQPDQDQHRSRDQHDLAREVHSGPPPQPSPARGEGG